MSHSPQQLPRFGDLEFDLEKRLLWRKGRLVPLAPKLGETLALLLEREGQVVEKRELVSKVWPDTVVEENSLSQNISALRKILGSAPDGKPYIETVAKRGYRFVVAPAESGDLRPTASPDRTDQAVSGQTSIPENSHANFRERVSEESLKDAHGSAGFRRAGFARIFVAVTAVLAILFLGYVLGRMQARRLSADVGRERPMTFSDHPAHSKYEFESDDDGWVVRPGGMITRAARSDEHPYAGNYSLAIVFGGPFTRKSQVYVANPPIAADKEVTAHVRCPEQNRLEAIALFAEDQNNAWNNDWSKVRLARGSWNGYLLRIPSDSAPLTRLGIEFTSAAAWSGTCYLDSVEW